MTHQPAIITVNATWERAALRLQRDETTLRLSITGHRRTPSRSRRAPIDIAFVIDRSGSMSGERLDLAKAAVSEALNHLGPEDRVTVVTFDHEIDVVQRIAAVTPSISASLRHNLERME